MGYILGFHEGACALTLGKARRAGSILGDAGLGAHAGAEYGSIWRKYLVH